MQIARVIALLLLMLPAVGVFGQDQGNCSKPDPATRPDCDRAKAFFIDLQGALNRDDRTAIAAMTTYPLRTDIRGDTVFIKDRAALIAHFQEIFDKHVRCSIGHAKVTDVWGNWSGFTIKAGTVWFDGVIPQGAKVNINDPDYWNKYPIKIKTVNHGATNDGCK